MSDKKSYFKLKLQTIKEDEEVLEFRDQQQVLTFTPEESFIDKIMETIFYCCKSMCVPTHMYEF